MFFKSKYKHFLSIVCIFKNESVAIAEWIDHYLAEGVEHFYMIDNGSTDDTVSRLQQYIDRGLITLVQDEKKWAQVELYNKYFLTKKKESEWLLVCDLDEFIYARNGFKSIADYLRSRASTVGLIRVPWKMFGSAGYQSQPSSIIQSFNKRSLYEGKQSPGMIDTSKMTSKVIVKSRYLIRFNTHFCEIKSSCRIEDPTGLPISLDDRFFQPISEELLDASYLHLNHYAIQSKRWFLEVKSTRGAADVEAHEFVRNLEYFETFDRECNDIEDTELSTKKNDSVIYNQKRPGK